MEQYIKKEDLKDVITSIIDDDYIHKDRIYEILTETEWSDEQDYRKRYIELYKQIKSLLN